MSISKQSNTNGSAECRMESYEALSKHSVAEIVDASGLPESARRFILRITKRTRLSRGEKADVAIELTAHFGDGLDMGAPLDELLSEFEDEEMFAKLVRRGKLRCRSWPRRMIRRLGQVFACLIVFYIGAIIYYAIGRPNVTVDYVAKINEDVAAPESERAWPIYREALLKLDRERVESLSRAVRAPDTAEWNKAAAFVSENEAVFATIRQAAAKPHFGAVLSTKISEEDLELWPENKQEEPLPSVRGEFESLDTLTAHIRIPYLTPLRAVTSLLEIDTIEASRRGDGDRVLANLVTMLGLAQQLNSRACLIEQLTGWAIGRQTVNVCGRLLRENREVLSDKHLRELAHQFANDDAFQIATLSGERYFAYDITQRMYTKSGRLTVKGVKWIRMIEHDLVEEKAPSTGMAVLSAPFYNGFTASRDDLIKTFNQFFDHTEAEFQLPYWESRGKDDALMEWVNSLSVIDRFKYSLVVKFMPVLSRVNTLQQESVGIRDGLLVALALELYQRQHNRYPDSLEDLSPRLLPSIPLDRITGSALRYRVNGDQAVVYSVGQNLVDDGGVMPGGTDTSEITDGETSRQRKERIIKAAGPGGSTGNLAQEGDWILWHSAGWLLEAP